MKSLSMILSGVTTLSMLSLSVGVSVAAHRTALPSTMTLNIGLSSDPPKLDPALSSALVDRQVMVNLYHRQREYPYLLSKAKVGDESPKRLKTSLFPSNNSVTISERGEFAWRIKNQTTAPTRSVWRKANGCTTILWNKVGWRKTCIITPIFLFGKCIRRWPKKRHCNRIR